MVLNYGKVDGTATGTVITMTNTDHYHYPDWLTVYNGNLYFTADDGLVVLNYGKK